MRKHKLTEITLALVALGFIIIQTACDTGLRETQVTLTYLYLTFESDRAKAQIGEPVLMRFTVTNTGKQPIVLESKDKPVMDIVVRVAGGGVLLSWSERNPHQIAHRMEWRPGESKVIELVWIPKQDDVYVGAYHDVFLSGILNDDSIPLQGVGVRLCASNFCR